MDAVNASTLTLKLHTLVAPNTTTLILTIDEQAGRSDAHLVRNSLVTTLYTILSSNIFIWSIQSEALCCTTHFREIVQIKKAKLWMVLTGLCSINFG